jgi:hypothetical protein
LRFKNLDEKLVKAWPKADGLIFSIHFDMSRIFLLFIIFLFTSAAVAQSDEINLYLVKGVATNSSGKSPADARNIAVAKARREGFLVLLTRLEIMPNIADNITDAEISNMVKSEQVNDEKISANSYSATFNIIFAKDFVDYILAKKIVMEAKKSEEIYLLIPAKKTKSSLILWEDNNDWKKAIAKIVNDRPSKKFIIPDSDIGNIALINSDNFMLADYDLLEPILSKYKTDAAYTLLFTYDEIENKVIINVCQIHKLQKNQTRLSFINVDRLNQENLLNQVAKKTIDYLLAEKSSQKPVFKMVQIQIPVTSLGNWLMIKNKIENSNLINQLNIESISRDYALIGVKYLYDKTDIKEAFLKIGLSLNEKAEDFYILSN